MPYVIGGPSNDSNRNGDDIVMSNGWHLMVRLIQQNNISTTYTSTYACEYDFLSIKIKQQQQQQQKEIIFHFGVFVNNYDCLEIFNHTFIVYSYRQPLYTNASLQTINSFYSYVYRIHIEKLWKWITS